MQIMHVFTKNLANGHNARTSTTLHIFCCDHFYETYKRKEGGLLTRLTKRKGRGCIRIFMPRGDVST